MVAVGLLLGGSLYGAFPFPLISVFLYALLSAELTAVGIFKSRSLL